MKDSIKKTREYQKVYKRGKSFANKYLVMYILKNERTENRLGISVSKKVGNSVVRHRLTRLIREGYRLNKDLFIINTFKNNSYFLSIIKKSYLKLYI